MVRYHSDAANYECPVCYKKFKTCRRRNAHRRQVHEEGKHKCEICARLFRDPSSLKTHENQMHDKNRLFECNLCDRKCITKKCLLDHVMDIHFKSKITCEICGTKLARIINYKIHLKTMHKDLGEEALKILNLRMKKLKPDYEKMEFYYDD